MTLDTIARTLESVFDPAAAPVQPAGAAPPPPAPPAAASPLDRLPNAIRAVAPHLSDINVVTWAGAMAPPLRSSGIVTVNRLAAFLGQVAEESGGFTALSENLNYSPERLRVIWPGRFTGPSGASAEDYAHNPEKLANLIYANRLGNGNEASGDGWTFRGAGLIQLTGRTFHTQFGQTVGLGPAECTAWMLTPRGASASACWYWTLAYHRPALNALAESWDIEAITKAVNGGMGNYATRLQGSVAARAALLAG